MGCRTFCRMIFLNQSCPPLTNFDNQLKKGILPLQELHIEISTWMRRLQPLQVKRRRKTKYMWIHSMYPVFVIFIWGWGVYIYIYISCDVFFFNYTDRDTVCVVQMLPLFNTTGWLLGWFGVHLQQVGQPGCNIVQNLSAHFRWFWSHPPPESTWCAKRHLCMSHGSWAPIIGASLTRRILKLGVNKNYKIYL